MSTANKRSGRLVEKEQSVSYFSISHEMIGSDIDLLKVSGFLDAHTFRRLEEAIGDIFPQRRYKLIVDLTNVDYISSAGAGVLIAALSQAEENGGQLVLLNPRKDVTDVLDMLGLVDTFSVAGHRQDAVAALSS